MIRILLLLCSLSLGTVRSPQDLINLVGKKGEITHFYDLYSRSRHLSPAEFGAKCDGVTGDYSAFHLAIDSARRSGEPILIPPGTCRIESTLTLSATNNGLTMAGSGRLKSILKFTGSGDGFRIGGNLNGFVLQDIRLDGNSQGRSAIVIDTGAASANPDAGVLDLARLDIRSWLKHALVERLTVATKTDHLEIVSQGGNGILFESATPRATTWTDVASWIHGNGGHGIVLDGPLSVTLDGTIMDSNTGLSTDTSVIGYAGYTLTLQAGGYVNCVSTDISRSVTRNGSNIGSLAHYDNTSREWVINASAAISSGGALAVASGTGAGTGTGSQKNNIGLYARGVVGLVYVGGHIENQLYGTFFDRAYDCFLAPSYILTQGSNAWGHYMASTTSRVFLAGTGIDVQAGGAGDIYFGALTVGPVLFGEHGAYTFTNRSQNCLVTTALNASSLYQEMRSTDPEPMQISGYDASWATLRIDAKTSGARPGIRFYSVGTLKTIIATGTGTPEGAVTASPGSLFERTDGGSGTSFYVKESGTGNTGWVGK